MRFDFRTASAAINNTDAARTREACRMACIACGVSLHNHQVKILNKPKCMPPDRWEHFLVLDGAIRLPEVTVWPAEDAYRAGSRMPGIVNVGIKTSVNCKNDQQLLEYFDVLMCHEYDPHFDDHPALLPVPFLLHDRVMREFNSASWEKSRSSRRSTLLQCYIENDLKAIRDWARDGVENVGSKMLGFRGNGMWPNRIKLKGSAPNWVEFDTYETHDMTALEHMRWLCQFRSGMMLSGDTPKVNIHGLLCLLGLVIVSPPKEVRDTPRLDESNSIVFENWHQVLRILEDKDRFNQILVQAEQDYLEGWSPKGQAGLLLEKISGLVA